MAPYGHQLPSHSSAHHTGCLAVGFQGPQALARCWGEPQVRVGRTINWATQTPVNFGCKAQPNAVQPARLGVLPGYAPGAGPHSTAPVAQCECECGEQESPAACVPATPLPGDSSSRLCLRGSRATPGELRGSEMQPARLCHPHGDEGRGPPGTMACWAALNPASCLFYVLCLCCLSLLPAPHSPCG